MLYIYKKSSNYENACNRYFPTMLLYTITGQITVARFLILKNKFVLL